MIRRALPAVVLTSIAWLGVLTVPWLLADRSDDATPARTPLVVRPIAKVEHPAAPPIRAMSYLRRDGIDLQFDVDYPARLDGPAPAVVLLHGGGWWSGNRGQLNAPGGLAHELAVAGFVAVSADYGLACSTPGRARASYGYTYDTDNADCGSYMRDQVRDVRALLVHLRRNAARLRIDPKRIGILGISAGGHLGLLAATTARHTGESASALVNWSGPTASEFIAEQAGRPVAPDKSLRAPFTNAIGCEPAACPGMWAAMSPARQLDAKTPKLAVLSIVGAKEPQVPLDEVQSFHAQLDQLGFENVVAAGADTCHGSSCGMRRLDGAGTSGLDASIEFLRAHLSSPTRER